MGAREHEDNDLPLRSAVIEKAEAASDQDEEDFSTLVQVLKDLDAAEAKCGDMNALDRESKVSLETQVAGYQFALNEIILPLKETIRSTIGSVKLKQLEAREK